jgi:hypothetical protein
MNKALLKESLGWGVGLWAFGYVLGIIFFFVLPTSVIGWAIMPLGVALILWILLARVKDAHPAHYVMLGVVWTLIAAALDYVFIVKAINPADGYYKLDVYAYYALTFLIPMAVGLWKAAGDGSGYGRILRL